MTSKLYKTHNKNEAIKNYNVQIICVYVSADIQANLPCISSVDSSETFLEPGGTYRGIRLRKYIFVQSN